jgi:hypothetical protein
MLRNALFMARSGIQGEPLCWLGTIEKMFRLWESFCRGGSESDLMQSFALLTWVRHFPQLAKSGEKTHSAIAMDLKARTAA